MSNTLTKNIFFTDAGFGALALRIPVGVIFAAHGAQKLFGWFGGFGLEGTAGCLSTR
jgi:putative oxidoreductase